MEFRPLRIAILTNGRFHVLDLARELAALGHKVHFYSLVPPWRTRGFGLPSECNRWLLPWVFHWYAALRAMRRTRFRHWAELRLAEALDRAAAGTLQPCDVFIGMSGMANLTAAVAKKKFGAQIWIERASRHILSQKNILDAMPSAEHVPDYAVRRELRDYEQADIVSVLSRHCEESFLDYGFPREKLFRNPLGVNLVDFPPTPAPPANPPTILMTGLWSLQKGCDLLTAAWRKLPNVRLLHVGSVGDCPLPQGELFEHVDKVEQRRLVEYYARCQVFALPSRQDGFPLVVPQALACGLRVVCSDRTGAGDICEMIEDPTALRVVPTENVDSLADALAAALEDSRNDTGLRDRLGKVRDQLSWAAYARRYEKALLARGVGAPGRLKREPALD